jgi:hypothetical protein
MPKVDYCPLSGVLKFSDVDKRFDMTVGSYSSDIIYTWIILIDYSGFVHVRARAPVTFFLYNMKNLSWISLRTSISKNYCACIVTYIAKFVTPGFLGYFTCVIADKRFKLVGIMSMIELIQRKHSTNMTSIRSCLYVVDVIAALISDLCANHES